MNDFQKQIGDLKKETTTTTASTGNTDTPSSKKIIEIPEFAIKFAAPDSIKDLNYVFTDEHFQVGFTTTTLKNAGCDIVSGMGPLGIIRISKLSPTEINDPHLTLVKQVPGDGRYLYYSPNVSGCSDNSATVVLQGSQSAALREALKSAVEIRQSL